jgi:trehalose 6-phosphate phosphatase
MRKAPHWSERWKQIEEQLRSRPRVLLACDFDGTVAPIVARPDEAQLPAEMRALLRQLATRGGVTLAMVSGRALEDVRQRVGIEGIFCCGNHGLEIDGPDTTWSSADAHAHRPELADAMALLRRQSAGIEGVIIEDKGLTGTGHWRLVPDESRDALREMVGAAVQSHSGLRLAYGKAVWEIRPRVDWNKGAAIRHLLKRLALTTADTICLGDDDTDESSFRALPDGVTLRVGASATSTARFLLNDVADTAAFLFCVLSARHTASASPTPQLVTL